MNRGGGEPDGEMNRSKKQKHSWGNIFRAPKLVSSFAFLLVVVSALSVSGHSPAVGFRLRVPRCGLRLCGGGRVPRCEHGRVKYVCTYCGGGGICQHQRRRERCKDCGGSQICGHMRQRSTCKECGGSGLCAHHRQRSKCKDCGGSSICEHARQRSVCADCGGNRICEHLRRRERCKDCRTAKDTAAKS